MVKINSVCLYIRINFGTLRDTEDTPEKFQKIAVTAQGFEECQKILRANFAGSCTKILKKKRRGLEIWDRSWKNLNPATPKGIKILPKFLFYLKHDSKHAKLLRLKRSYLFWFKFNLIYNMIFLNLIYSLIYKI